MCDLLGGDLLGGDLGLKCGGFVGGWGGNEEVFVGLMRASKSSRMCRDTAWLDCSGNTEVTVEPNDGGSWVAWEGDDKKSEKSSSSSSKISFAAGAGC